MIRGAASDTLRVVTAEDTTVHKAFAALTDTRLHFSGCVHTLYVYFKSIVPTFYPTRYLPLWLQISAILPEFLLCLLVFNNRSLWLQPPNDLGQVLLPQ